MKNFVQVGDVLDLILTADVASGGITIQGSIVGVAQKAGVTGDTVPHKTTGVYDLPYGVAATISAGDKIYWDTTNSRVTKTATANTLIGHATEARASGAATARVRLVPVP
ncbi:MAG TPA: DUF2190 family protein [Devosia sp.]|jgi:predicted RecA/RadA family phage recombinase|nr:DUF2190 family protein [Devosia sp.]